MSSLACDHCGTTFTPLRPSDRFCCAGCEFVAKLIKSENLDRFYDLRDTNLAPVKTLVFEPRDFTWLARSAEAAESRRASPAAPAELTLDVQGLSCVGCVWLVEKLFARHPGALGAGVDPTLGRAVLRWTPGACDLPGFARELQRFGYVLGPVGVGKTSEASGLTVRLGLCAAFAMNNMLFTLPVYLGMGDDFALANLFQLIVIGCATLSLAVGGGYFMARAWQGLAARSLHLDLPIAIGLLAAYLGSLAGWLFGQKSLLYFDFVSVFTFLMLLGRWTQIKAVERNRHRLLDLNPRPEAVRALPAGMPLDEADASSAVETPVAEIVAGQFFWLPPGRVLPVLGELAAPAASFSLAWINGESDTRRFERRGRVPAGAQLIGNEPVPFRALETWQNSLLARLTADSAPRTRLPVLVEQVLRVYLPAVLVVAFLGGLSWWIIGGDPVKAAQVFISVLVVSCPCATGVALPLCDELAVARLRRLGVFLRVPDFWGRLRRVRSVVFDKTGTLTLEAPALLNPESLDGLSPEASKALVRLVETNLHPVGRALRAAALSRFSAEVVKESLSGHAPVLRETIARGVCFENEVAVWSLGRVGWSPLENQAVVSAPSVVVLASPSADCELRRNGELVASFRLAEAIRADAPAEIAALRASGLEVAILSGDQPAKVARMADQLGLPRDRAIGGLSPDGKADWLREAGASRILFVGDGANDSLAFDAACCRGTPVADQGLLEGKSDFYFLGRGLRGVRAVFETAALRQRAVGVVFGTALAYNLTVVSLSLAGHMSPLIAAIVMPLSSLVTVGLAGWFFRKD